MYFENYYRKWHSLRNDKECNFKIERTLAKVEQNDSVAMLWAQGRHLGYLSTGHASRACLNQWQMILLGENSGAIHF